MIPGETLPNLRGDDSFQRLLEQKEFQQVVDTLYSMPK
jgi:hypothetical protein